MRWDQKAVVRAHEPVGEGGGEHMLVHHSEFINYGINKHYLTTLIFSLRHDFTLTLSNICDIDIINL